MTSEVPSPPRRRPSLDDQIGRFKGVRMRSWGRWVSEIRIPNSRDKIWLGSYSMPELAARAYDTAYLLLRGPSASSSLNLSDSAHLITPYLAAYTNGHHAITRRTIQTAAAEIANAIAGVETPLELIIGPASEEQGRATSARLDADQSGEESCRDMRVGENSMGEACLKDVASMESGWIHDVLSLLSPREKTSSIFLSAYSAAASKGGSMSCAAKLMSANSLAVCGEVHEALQVSLAQDGFTPMSRAVTTCREI